MWRLRSCPRCGGDLVLEPYYLDLAVVGYVWDCIHCGYEVDFVKKDATLVPQIGG